MAKNTSAIGRARIHDDEYEFFFPSLIDFCDRFAFVISKRGGGGGIAGPQGRRDGDG